MDFATITQFGGALAALMPLVLIACFVFVIWRTVSLHTLLRRLWLLVHGSEDISDPQIRAYVDEQTNLMSFRMFSGVQAASLEEAHQLIAWAQHHRVDLRRIAACGRYFDTGLQQVRKQDLPSRPYLFAQIALFAVSLVGSLALAWLMLIPQVPFTFKSSERTFLATESSAQTLWPPVVFNRNPLKKGDCDQPLAANAARTSFTEAEVKTLCEFLPTDEWPPHLANKLKEQRWFLFICTLFFLALLARAVMVLNKVVAAKDLLARGLTPALPGAQAELDFCGPKD
ncbi:hypothetical protein QF021_004075 [Acidovorax delafieldii]|uniref:DUF6216 family protein n=1 Tax=Acidovorax delafieldii TaxID=47920 RepID=UPI0028563D32|nr:DUF6216 family protein [Acidovorax delafieldii]MDR6155986.1 hypothetical protein [Acidovorax delafieldii]